ncbi:MAG: hypothetical protein Q9223_003476 [Gallowayella weberi]
MEQQKFSIFEDGSDEAHTEGPLMLELRFHDHNLHVIQAQESLDQFTHILQQICQNPEQRYEEVATPSPGSLQRLREWNGAAPAKVDACIHNLIEKHLGSQASSQAVAEWNVDFKYGALDELSSKQATHLVGLVVGPEHSVPLCFEKSKWSFIGIIGVLRAGAAFVPINPEQLVKTLKYIVGGSDRFKFHFSIRSSIDPGFRASGIRYCCFGVLTVRGRTVANYTVPWGNQKTQHTPCLFQEQPEYRKGLSSNMVPITQPPQRSEKRSI